MESTVLGTKPRLGTEPAAGNEVGTTSAGPGGLERSGGERSEPERSGGPPGPADVSHRLTTSAPPPDPEVPEKPVRRRFSAKYKLRILKEADACKGKLGKIGELLRREGLYSSHLTTWRTQQEKGMLQGLAPSKRGRKAKKVPKSLHEKELERENRRLRRRLEKVDLMLEIQKKTSELLGIPLDSPGSDEDS